MRIVQKALRPQREACSDAQRMELWRKQDGKCALCEIQLRDGEDEAEGELGET